MSHTTPPSGQGPDDRQSGDQPRNAPTPPYPGQTTQSQANPGPAYPGQTTQSQHNPGQANPGPAFPGQTYPGQARPGQAPGGGAPYGSTPQYGVFGNGGAGNGGPSYGGPGYGAPQYGGLPPASSGSKGLAIAALICGIVSLVFAWVPFVNILALVAGLVAITLGVVSLVRKLGGTVMAWFGAGLGLLGILVTVLAMLAFAAVGSITSRPGPLTTYNDEMNKQISVKYIVTTSTPTDVRASTPTGTSETTISTDRTQEFTAKGKDSLRVSATSADSKATDAKVSCEIQVDGTSVAKETGEGKYATASCSYYKSLSRYSSDKPVKEVSVEFKVTTNVKVASDSNWSASGGGNRSSRYTEVNTDTTTTFKAKGDGSLDLTVRGLDREAPSPAFGCEILVDGKSVSKQSSNTSYGTARCTYQPQD